MAPRKPPMKTSEESTKAQLTLATAQGAAYAAALAAMDEESGAKSKRAGDYEVIVVIEEAEGMWMPDDSGKLAWQEPTEENAHVEVAVRDAADGRFIPALDITVTLTAPDGSDVGTHPQTFMWHPWLYHYGRNWTVPGPGDYGVHVHIAAPTFMRHDHENGNRFAVPVEVDFTVSVEPDQKLVEGKG
ncbi:MAG: iron transporter [Chloroflexota bacterium]|nr:iron transporter [Chloroflexota bacterium]